MTDNLELFVLGEEELVRCLQNNSICNVQVLGARVFLSPQKQPTEQSFPKA